MLRELIDTALLEDFVSGLAAGSGLRVCAYGVNGDLIAAAPAAGQTGIPLPAHLPPRLELEAVAPASEPPARLAFVEHAGAWTVVAPVYVHENVVGFVGIGAFRDPTQARELADANVPANLAALPLLDRRGDARPVALARWAARLLAEWCQHEARLEAAAAEIALLGDVGELISGERDLQTILDRICAETARVMNLPYCSLRLYDPETDELVIKAGYNLPEVHAAEKTLLRRDNPIDDEALRGRIVYVEDAARDPRIRFREQAQRQGIVSGLIAGMMYHGRPIGVLRVYADHRKRFRARHRNLLRVLASQAAIAIAHARLLEERLRNAAAERQLATAGQIQARMIRTPPPQHPRLQAALVFDPSWHVSGDFCDILPTSDGGLAAVVGDVVGHGVGASLLAASIRGALRALLETPSSPTEILNRLNRYVYRETSSAEFVTLLLATVNARGDRLTYASAGHEPLLLRRDGRIISHDQAGLVLGLRPDEHYGEHTVELHPGDFALLYTDGVIEAMDFAGRTFGRSRLLSALRTYGGEHPDQVLRNIRWDVRRFVGLADQSDDLTMVGLRVCEGQERTAAP